MNNDHQANRLMNTLLTGLLLFILLFLSADLLLKAQHYGYTLSQVESTLYGNEELFIDPLPLLSLLQGIHADIFFAMMILLSIGAVYGRVGRSKRLRIILINLTMFSALIALLAPFLALYLHKVWIFFWIFSSLLWHVLAIAISFVSLWRLRFP
ncbi:MAG: hypothetical protein U9N52_10170 [Campylobacterota bacterium]|nr:hypothetical protein [Campylobacterota bacterium]